MPASMLELLWAGLPGPTSEWLNSFYEMHSQQRATGGDAAAPLPCYNLERFFKFCQVGGCVKGQPMEGWSCDASKKASCQPGSSFVTVAHP